MSKTFCITKASTALHALLLKTAPAEIEKKTSKSLLKELHEIAAQDGTISYQEKVLLQALNPNIQLEPVAVEEGRAMLRSGSLS